MNLVNKKNKSMIKQSNRTVDYFMNLPKWDGEDYIHQLSRYIKVPYYDRNRFKIQLKKMFVRTIASFLNPHITNTYSFILISNQREKLSFLKWLCPNKLADLYIEKNDLDTEQLT